MRGDDLRSLANSTVQRSPDGRVSHLTWGALKSLAYRDPTSRHGKVRPVAGKAKMTIDRSFVRG